MWSVSFDADVVIFAFPFPSSGLENAHTVPAVYLSQEYFLLKLSFWDDYRWSTFVFLPCDKTPPRTPLILNVLSLATETEYIDSLGTKASIKRNTVAICRTQDCINFDSWIKNTKFIKPLYQVNRSQTWYSILWCRATWVVFFESL